MKPTIVIGIRLAVVLMLVSGCMVSRQSGPGGGGDLNTIRDIQVLEELDQNKIRIIADRPLIYTSYELAEPDRLIIDLAGTSVGNFSDAIPVNRGGIVQIQLIPGEPPSNVSRIEIQLSGNVGSQIRADKSELIIVVENPLGEVLPLSEKVPEPPAAFEKAAGEDIPMEGLSDGKAQEPSSMPDPPQATVVSDLSFSSTPNAVEIQIAGDGPLEYKVFQVEGNRLVVDIKGVENKIRPNAISVHHETLEGIRIGQHFDPKKVRVVFDLNREIIYSTEAVGNEIHLEIIKKGVLPQPKTALPQKVGEKAPASRPQNAGVKKSEAPKQTSSGPVVKYVGSRVSLDFQDADIQNILRLLADVSGYNLVMAGDVGGKVTLKLLNVPWDQAFDIVLKLKNLGQIREGNIIRVASIVNITKQRDEEARAKETLIKAEDLITRVIYVNYAVAEELAEPLKKTLSPRGDITVDARTNTMIVKDIEENIDEIVDLVRLLDARTPQVMIQARIVQADSSFARSLGIQWGVGFAHLDSNNIFNIQGINGESGSQPAFGVIAPDFGINLPGTVSGLSAVPTLGFSFGRFTDNPINLDLRLSAGELNGTSKTISSPRITTLDNVQAKIEQGESIPFQTTSDSGTKTEFIDANLTLEVTPHITSDGSIIMKVKAARNSIGSFSGPAGPSISKREATTTVLVRNGETTVIGGIFVEESGETRAGIPFLSRIPIIGRLFKSETKTETKNELLIFLTPTIIED